MESMRNAVSQDWSVGIGFRIDPRQEHSVALMLHLQNRTIGEPTDLETPLS